MHDGAIGYDRALGAVIRVRTLDHAAPELHPYATLVIWPLMLTLRFGIVVIVVRPVVEINRFCAIAHTFRVQTTTRSITRWSRIVTQTLVITSTRIVVVSTLTKEQHLHVDFTVAGSVGIVVVLVFKIHIRLRRHKRK